MRHVLAVAALVAAFVFLAPLMARAARVTVMTATPCVPVSELPALQKEFGEHPIGAGLSIDGKALYYLMRSKDGAFTMIRRDASGLACFIGGGVGWSSISPPIEGEGL